MVHGLRAQSPKYDWDQGSELRIMGSGPGGDTHIHYLYGYVPPNGVVILKLLV